MVDDENKNVNEIKLDHPETENHSPRRLSPDEKMNIRLMVFCVVFVYLVITMLRSVIMINPDAPVGILINLAIPLFCFIHGHRNRYKYWSKTLMYTGLVLFILLPLTFYDPLTGETDIIDEAPFYLGTTDLLSAIFIWEIILLPFVLLIVSIIWRKRKWARSTRNWGIGILTVYIVIIGLIVLELTYFSRMRDRNMERRCHEALLTLAAIQDSYRGDTPTHSYGTWLNLIDDGFIRQGYTRFNFIDYYSITLFDIQNPNENPEVNQHGFRIVAQPRDPYAFGPRLRTFAICEDKQLRLWVGELDTDEEFDPETTDLNNTNLWEPLR